MTALTFEQRGAQFSDDRVYRYALWRIWGGEPTLNVIGLNPSTADEQKDDPTIRRCIGFAKRWGHGGLVMTNLFAYRSTDPAALATVADPDGPLNDQVQLERARGAGRVLVAWGSHKSLLGRDAWCLALLADHHVPLFCLGTTKHGHPRHPLYVPGETDPIPYLGLHG